MRSSRMTIWVMVAIVFVNGQAMGWTQYNDGGTHDITSTINDDVWVDWNSPEMGTTVNILESGAIPHPYGLRGYEDSIINIFDGPIGHVYAYDNCQLTITGGVINTAVYPSDNSQIFISGGSILSLDTSDNSYSEISGGSISSLILRGNAHVELLGGAISNELQVQANSTLLIYGSDFEVDGQPVGFGEITSILGGNFINEPHRYLTGILANGGIVDNGFRIGYNAKIVLVPEPATLLLLSLGGLVLRKKR